jgi:hypothetical protein
MPSSDELLHGNRRDPMWLVNAFSTNDRRLFISHLSVYLSGLGDVGSVLPRHSMGMSKSHPISC